MSRAAASEPVSATRLVALTVAGALAAAWLSMPSPGELAFMRYKDGHLADAVGVYELQLARGDYSAEVVAPLAHIYMEQGEADRAVQLLERHGARNPGDMRAHELLADAYRLAGREADYLGELETLAEAAPTAARLRELAWLYARRDDPERELATLRQLVRREPENAGDRIHLARLLTERGDPAAGALALGTISKADLAGLDATTRTAHFQVLLAAGHLDDAAADLTARAVDPATPPQSFTDLAGAFLEADRAADGLRHLTLMRALRPLPETDAAWARLAAAAGHGTQVAAWIADQGEAAPELLQDLYHLGADSGQTALAVAAANRAFAQDPAPQARRELALALLAAGEDAKALPHLRKLAPGNDQYDFLYRAALERLGRTGELSAHLRQRAAAPRTDRDQRRETAFALLALGNREAALETFLTLAKHAPTDDPDVRELLYLWGPRPGHDALNWLAGRARGASGAERTAWLQTLLDLGGAAQVADIMDDAGGTSDPAATRLHLRALAQTGDLARLEALVRAYLPTESDPEQLRQYAVLAEHDHDTAEAAWTRLLAVAPGDPEALRQLGRFALARQDYAAAAPLLARSLEREPDDLDTRYAYATALTQLGRDAEAAKHYRATVALAADTPDRPETRLAVANSLDRLGRTGEAVAAFETLRREDPGDRKVLGEYAAMLYRNGMLDRFRQVTEAR